MSRAETIQLSRVALWAAVANETDKATAAVQEIADRFGGDAVVTAMIA